MHVTRCYWLGSTEGSAFSQSFCLLAPVTQSQPQPVRILASAVPFESFWNFDERCGESPVPSRGSNGASPLSMSFSLSVSLFSLLFSPSISHSVSLSLFLCFPLSLPLPVQTGVLTLPVGSSRKHFIIRSPKKIISTYKRHSVFKSQGQAQQEQKGYSQATNINVSGIKKTNQNHNYYNNTITVVTGRAVHGV